jgi:transcriptional regulator with XRE-family HTH domain
MRTNVSDLHEARLFLRPGSKLADNVFLYGNIDFPDTTPYGVIAHTTYPAHILEIGNLGRWLKLQRGNMSQSKLAEQSHVSASTISGIETGALETHYQTARQIHRGLGGLGLYLAFSDAALEGTKEPKHILVAGIKNYAEVARTYFIEQREAKGLSLSELAKQSEQWPLVERPESGITTATTIADYFKNAFDIQVTYCATRPPA